MFQSEELNSGLLQSFIISFWAFKNALDILKGCGF